MGLINFFAQQQFAAMSRQGEVLEAMGIAIHPSTTARKYAVIGLTNQRLLVLIVPADPWQVAPKPESESSMSFELAQLGQVRVEHDSDLLGAFMRFVLVSPQGETAFVLRQTHKPFGNKWNFTGFEASDHADFNNIVAPWLMNQCAMGALRSPQGVEQSLGILRSAKQNRAAMMMQSAQMAMQADAVRRANAPVVWPYIVGGVCVLIALIGLAQIQDGSRWLTRSSEFEEQVDRSVKSKTGVWADPKVEKRARESIDHDRGNGYKHMAEGVVVFLIGAGASAGLFLLGVKLNKKKKEQLAQQQGGNGPNGPPMQPAPGV